MPISRKDFEEKGRRKTRQSIQRPMMEVLQANPRKAISSEDFERILGNGRQAINQALRSLEEKGLVERGLVQEGGRYKNYVILTEYGREMNVEEM